MERGTETDHWAEGYLDRIAAAPEFAIIPTWEWTWARRRTGELQELPISPKVRPPQPHFSLRYAVDEVMSRQRHRDRVVGDSSAYLFGPHWDRVRVALFILTDGHCEDCNAHLLRGDTHHRNYERTGWESLFDVESVCRRCHQKRHNTWNIHGLAYVRDHAFGGYIHGD